MAASTKATGFFRRQFKKLSEYLKALGSDYKNVAMDTVSDAKARPVKATVYIVTAAAFSYAAHLNPSLESFCQELCNASNDLLLVGDRIRNPNSDNHVQMLLKYQSKNLIQRQNFLFFSFIWYNNYGSEVSLYNAKCKHLSVGWFDMPSRCLDVGFLGRWFYLQKAMQDYDVNEKEFEGKS
ncbi:mitochondrial import inner membrane translocase subunit Tim29-like [Anneissia japonica]|uniref:mitochondrial import inner membrane translocase subunit Tim29-like n=1 Tax=Anneissia japonica TaxID=1529436 RepID=UPI001425827C|nr:mitochondrial import inner membrane translocase subunit Tim29-like [Anneissia japonica]